MLLVFGPSSFKNSDTCAFSNVYSYTMYAHVHVHVCVCVCMRACDCSVICIGAAGSETLPPPGGCKTKVPETESGSRRGVY